VKGNGENRNGEMQEEAENSDNKEKPPLTDEEMLLNLEGTRFGKKLLGEKEQGERELLRGLDLDENHYFKVLVEGEESSNQSIGNKDKIDDPLRLSHTKDDSSHLGGYTPPDSLPTASVKKLGTWKKIGYNISHPQRTLSRSLGGTLSKRETRKGHEESGIKFKARLINSASALKQLDMQGVYLDAEKMETEELDVSRYLDIMNKGKKRAETPDNLPPIAQLDKTEFLTFEQIDTKSGIRRIHQIDTSKVAGFENVDRKDFETTYTIELPENPLHFRNYVSGHILLSAQQYAERYAKENPASYKADPDKKVTITGTLRHVGTGTNLSAYIEIPSEKGEKLKTFVKLKKNEYGDGLEDAKGKSKDGEMPTGQQVSFEVKQLKQVEVKNTLVGTVKNAVVGSVKKVVKM
jgi:hypothetical protein